MVDWSARSKPSPQKPSPDSIWIAVAKGGAPECFYHRTRVAAIDALTALLQSERRVGRRVLVGFDFPFGYPRGFAQAVTGSTDPLALWADLAARVTDADDNSNNRWQVARELNGLFPGIGPFWGCPAKEDGPELPARGSERKGHGLVERRAVEARISSAQPCWKLYTTGSVGSQALLGLPHLHRLRQQFSDDVAIAPFQPPDTPIVFAEIYPSMLAQDVAVAQAKDEIKDRAQVRVLAAAFQGLAPEALDAMLQEGDAQEGWILGLGHEDALRGAMRGDGPTPPPLSNDCFALPAGVTWTPVDAALALLKERLQAVTGIETVRVQDALGRIMARDVVAARANPPLPNTAVDGYGFAGGRDSGVHVLPLETARAAAGLRLSGAVPQGSAIRVLTGAALPDGVDTVVLQEDVNVENGQVAFHGPVKAGSNTRKAGEDVDAGDVILSAGRRVTPADLALLAATGVGDVSVRLPLRVAVISTGDELVEAGETAGEGQIFDANRPMLLAMIAGFGHIPVDMGRVADDRAALALRLDDAAKCADVILTSGGASAGDEDHVSALLSEAGAMALWRIAIKPGRPLALGIWHDTPVFGLPGNPVAANVCTLVFARPAMAQLAGAGWSEPQGFMVPAGFEKRKKAGRREYLRARIRDGVVEVFASEGSGRISGLSWAEGLVELSDGAQDVSRGDVVRYIPFAGFE
jgi:molybdopterin molybdotransferase